MYNCSQVRNMKFFALTIAALFVAAEARIVTDKLERNPISGKYEVREVKSGDSFEDGPFGGNGGAAWTDGGDTHTYGPITEIEVRHGTYIDGLKTR